MDKLFRHRASTSTAAQTALICGLLTFAVLQLTAGVIIDRWWPGVRHPEYGRKLTLLRAQAAVHQGEPLLLALGTSRTAFGFCAAANGDETGWQFNFGLTGIGPVQELICFRRLLAEGLRPVRLLIEIHPAFLHQTSNWCEARAIDVRKLDASDLAVVVRYAFEPAELIWRWTVCRLSPWYSYRTELLDRLAPAWTDKAHRRDEQMLADTDSYGWSRYPVRPADDAERNRLGRFCAGLYTAPLSDFEVSDLPRRAIAEMIDLCRREQIDAALVLMPEGERFGELYTPQAQQRLDAYLSRLRETDGTPIFDCRRWCGDEQFCDGQHLLPEGAAAFTARLRQRDLAPWLAARTKAAAELAQRPKEAGR